MGRPACGAARRTPGFGVGPSAPLRTGTSGHGNIRGRGGIAGNVIIDIWDGWEKVKKSEADRKKELEALAQQPSTKLNEAVSQVVREVAPTSPRR